MTTKQYQRAMSIRDRIHELENLQGTLGKRYESVFIGSVRIPENSREVILALCLKEKEQLEKEFENL